MFSWYFQVRLNDFRGKCYLRTHSFRQKQISYQVINIRRSSVLLYWKCRMMICYYFIVCGIWHHILLSILRYPNQCGKRYLLTFYEPIKITVMGRKTIRYPFDDNIISFFSLIKKVMNIEPSNWVSFFITPYMLIGL